MKLSAGQTITWLLDGDPAIRWQTMRDLNGAPTKTFERERRRVERDGWGARLLAKQGLNGRWAGGRSSDGGLYTPKWISTTYTMLLLRDFGLRVIEGIWMRGFSTTAGSVTVHLQNGQRGARRAYRGWFSPFSRISDSKTCGSKRLRATSLNNRCRMVDGTAGDPPARHTARSIRQSLRWKGCGTTSSPVQKISKRYAGPRPGGASFSSRTGCSVHTGRGIS